MKTLAAVVLLGASAWYLRQRHQGGAGASATARARSLRSPLVRLAEQLGITTARGRRAAQWAAGAAGEKATADRLAPLALEGWTVLHDRALPVGAANVDHLLVSPAGVVIVLDSKKWSARWPLRVRAGRLLHGTCDVTPRLRGVRHEATVVAQVLECSAVAMVSMDGPSLEGGELVVEGVRIVAAERAVPALRTAARRHRATVPHPGQRAARLFPAYRRK
ncbi:NERD domain-containing protein [Streptomycetaceae bacterium NBC_01309]